MPYRNLTSEQFEAVKKLAAHLCIEKKLKTVGEYKKVANEIIDEIDAGKKRFVTDCASNIVILTNE